jgi:hypothetical protein
MARKSKAVHVRLNPATLALNTAENISAIVSDDVVFRLTKPITLDSYKEGSLWHHEYAPLNIVAYGKTEEESLRDFAGYFASCWRVIAEEEDSRLASDARRMKAMLHELVSEVEPAREFLSR